MQKHPIVDQELAKLNQNQKANYQQILLKVCEDHQTKGERPKLLIHSCCAVCMTVAIDVLVKYMDITIYFYNPNIHPKSEFMRRQHAQEKFINDFNAKYGTDVKFLATDYTPGAFFKRVEGFENEPEGSGGSGFEGQPPVALRGRI